MSKIIILIGPSNSGKDFFITNHLVPQIKEEGKKYFVVSSDEIRRTLLGDPSLHKHDNRMMHVSQQAFNLLYSLVDNHSQFSVNADYIIVNTTGLSKDFREKIFEIAHKNNYKVDAIIFNYKKRNDYFKFADEYIDKFVVGKHITKLRDAISNLERNKYDKIYNIKSHDAFETFKLKTEDSSNYTLPNDDYAIIGDIHGCYDEFIELLDKLKADERRQYKVILIGDLIDKGSKIREVIEYVYEHLDEFIIVQGNHENYVVKYLKGEIGKDTHKEYFDSIELFESDEELRNKLFAIYDKSLPCVKTDNFIVTHAPCEAKYLCKSDNYSQKKQKSFIYPKQRDFASIPEWKEAVSNSLNEMLKVNSKNYPYHIYGHIASTDFIKIKNSIGIDTGCVYGNKLSAAVIMKEGKVFYQSVKSNQEDNLKSLFSYSYKNKEVDLGALEPEDRRRINWIIKNKINFVSGTMSPANKTETELESLEEGLNYYKNNGIEEVVIQPKYMGSRCEIYLSNKIEECYAVSRNGYKIKLDLTHIYQKLIDRFKGKYELMIIDGELMPWKALGEGLIENEYKIAEKAIGTEIELLRATGFDAYIDVYKGLLNGSEIADDLNKVPKKDLIEKYGNVAYRTFSNFRDYVGRHIDTEEMLKYFSIYQRQIELFCADGEIEFKPFCLLKVVNHDGSEEVLPIKDNYENFKYVTASKGRMILICFSDENWLGQASSYYEHITEDLEMEGVVIKPRNIETKYVAPYLKVRNPNYLGITYGYDYQKEYRLKGLIEHKSINKKLRLSIQEWNLGLEMLKTPYKDITEDNKVYKNLVANMVLEINQEKELDGRL
jgi:predicted kinase